ncbi:MAG: cysteine desulfurase [Bacteroidota bacterium]
MDIQTITDRVPFNVEEVRKDFPALHQEVYGKPLVYFDNAATSQKPIQVIERLENYYKLHNSNVHRGVHFLSQTATDEYEGARKTIQKFINAAHEHEVIYTRGTTEGINLVASSFGRKFIQEGDEIIISHLEHHSNIVPWQLIAEERGATVKVIPINEKGEMSIEDLKGLITDKTRIIATLHVSNSLGSINPVEEIIQLAHSHDIPVLLDGAQAVPHMQVDVQALDCDFYVFSGHKMFGPTGTGVLYGKEKWLEVMPPYMGGGDMIKVVRMDKTTFNDLPHKFEAGTPHISGGIGMKEAIKYIWKVGYDNISRHEHELLEYGTEVLSNIDGLRIVGTAENKASVISFLVGDIHPYDLGTILDRLGIAIRTGHHCTQPIMDQFQIPGTMRASFAFYNTKAEIDRLAEAIQKGRKMFE